MGAKDSKALYDKIRNSSSLSPQEKKVVSYLMDCSKPAEWILDSLRESPYSLSAGDIQCALESLREHNLLHIKSFQLVMGRHGYTIETWLALTDDFVNRI